MSAPRLGLPLLTALAGFATSIGCQQDPPPAAPPHHTEPSGDVAAPPESPASAAERCDVMLRLEVQGEDRVRALRVYAENLRGERLELELPERCPAGLVDFEGLGAGYDYYGTCNAGACADSPPIRRITLEPQARRQLIAAAHIHLDGRAPCTTALPPGSYTVRPLPPETSASVCVEGAVLDVPAPLPPEEVAVLSKDPYWCETSADCVLSCPVSSKCCGWPCGCRHAINVRHKEAYEANYLDTCDTFPCPAVACAYEPAVAAVCRNHRCVGSSTLAF